jgi:2-polyprenyl-6-methoxyphenol hydroxylase-like FAD-dependent oxidoreductase
MRIVIIGAGVAGGAIARGLRDLPETEVIVVEQVSHGDHANAGNGLNIGPNALAALDAVLPEMSAELRQVSLPWTRWRASLADGTPLFHIPLAEVASCAGIRIRWADLYASARQPVADITLYDRQFVAIEDSDPAGRLSINLATTTGGDRCEIGGIDMLIACDGRYSRVRELSRGKPSVRHLGVANFRLLIEDDGASGIDDMEEWFNGPSRFLAFRVPDGRIYLSGNFPLVPGQDVAAEQKTVDGLRRIYLPERGHVTSEYEALLEATCVQLDALHWSRAQEIPTDFRDRSGRILFVGDSAHAMAPTLGQGATQALEDSCALIALMRRTSADGPIDVPRLTAAYDVERRQRIEFVKQFSWDASRVLLLDGDPIAEGHRKSGYDYRAQLRQLYAVNGTG